MSETSSQRGTALFTAEALAGHWRARRHIEDRQAGGTAYLSGVAVFSRDGHGMTYREGGRLYLPDGRSFEAHRTYLWRFPAPERVEVLFEDGRPFHDFDPRAPGRERIHPCGPDTYRGHYVVEGDQRWTSVWHVTGPRKDQRLTTRYSRL